MNSHHNLPIHRCPNASGEGLETPFEEEVFGRGTSDKVALNTKIIYTIHVLGGKKLQSSCVVQWSSLPLSCDYMQLVVPNKMQTYQNHQPRHIKPIHTGKNGKIARLVCYSQLVLPIKGFCSRKILWIILGF